MGPQQVGRALAGLIGYSPSPGIYSRLERAVEAMPKQVRVQELPGLIKRHKEGVPGWELRAVDLESLINDRPVVPREELLQAVRERSPVYTHHEIMLGGTPQTEDHPIHGKSNDYFESPVPIGRSGAQVFGPPKWGDYGHGGGDYTELLLVQPDHPGDSYGSHWLAHDNVAAHARYDTHGDALRINELQSDLGIHNRKMREQYAEYERMMRDLGREPGPMEYQADQPLPFPLEDAWADILIKRLLLETARRGHRAIEIASPRAIADKVGGNIDNYEHFYGKVVPGAIERLGRKLGGLTDDSPPPGAPTYDDAADAMSRQYAAPSAAADRLIYSMREGRRRQSPRGITHSPIDTFDDLIYTIQAGVAGRYEERADRLYKSLIEDLASRGIEADEARRRASQAMPQLMGLAEEQATLSRQYSEVRRLAAQRRPVVDAAATSPSRRYLMSDAMRKNIIQKGIGASVLAPLIADEEE